MIRSAFTCLLGASALFAQAPPTSADPLTVLRQNADKAAADWRGLAGSLEARIARLLPCDPKARAAVDEVSRASEVRLSALSAYLKAAALKAGEDTEAAKQVLAAQAALSGGWNTEQAEAEQEHAALDAQIADLKESMRKRSSLAGAERVLVELAKMVQERGAKSEEQASRRDAINTLLGNLVVAYHDRQFALENESAMLDGETAKWSLYYATRISRSVTECAIINPAALPKKKQR